MSTVIANSVSARSLVLTLILLFSVIAVGLSIAGVYGVLSYAVSRRTREIGIRMALGARATAVTAMVLGEAAMLVGVGLFIGVAAAMLMTGTLRSILYGIQPRDPLTFVVVPILVGIIAMLASAKPAFRAARIDPLGAIRSE